MIQKSNETPIPANPFHGDNHVFGMKMCDLEGECFLPCFGLVTILERYEWSDLYGDEN